MTDRKVQGLLERLADAVNAIDGLMPYLNEGELDEVAAQTGEDPRRAAREAREKADRAIERGGEGPEPEAYERYTYTLTWDNEDAVFICRVLEFPSVATHGENPGQAFHEAFGVVRNILLDMQANGETPPPPRGRGNGTDPPGGGRR